MAEFPWVVCHTRPRCEKKFAALLVAEKLAHYLPVVASVRRYAKQTKRFTKPLFPGYVFAQVPVGNGRGSTSRTCSPASSPLRTRPDFSTSSPMCAPSSPRVLS